MPPGALPRAALAAPTLLARRRWAAKETSGSRAEIQTFLACIGIVHGNSYHLSLGGGSSAQDNEPSPRLCYVGRLVLWATRTTMAMEWIESGQGVQQWIESIKRWRLRLGVLLLLFWGVLHIPRPCHRRPRVDVWRGSAV